MEKIKLIQFKNNHGEIVCSKVKLANNIYDRLLGLMFKKQLNNFDGLLIKPCNSIHTFFMKMNIDVIFLEK